MEERLGTEKAAKKGVQDGLRERELEVQELQARATGAEASLQKAQADLQERAEEVAKLKREFGELELQHAELKVERKQLEQQREEKESHGAQQQTEISQVSWEDRGHSECTAGNMTVINPIQMATDVYCVADDGERTLLLCSGNGCLNLYQDSNVQIQPPSNTFT